LLIEQSGAGGGFPYAATALFTYVEAKHGSFR
jgi:hypothetical protein